MSTVKINELAEKCCGCGACAAKCPKHCITMVEDKGGFLHPEIDLNKCVECGGCDAVCPVTKGGVRDVCHSAWWAKAKDTALLKNSSSGGLFGLLARNVIAHGGIVVGAAWDLGCRNLRHVCIDDICNLDSILRSKYVQSSIDSDVYRSIAEAIDSRRPTLFAGTACQVAGVKSYLGKRANSDFFLSVDVICHGVPSPMLWRRWLDYRENLFEGKIEGVNFRSKTSGWLTFSVEYSYRSDAEDALHKSSTVFSNDWYMRAFLQNASLRPSCFICPFKRSCGSDVTLGDYWGVQNAHPNIEYSEGVSAAIINTTKGYAALTSLFDRMELGASAFDSIASGNPALIQHVCPHNSYIEFQNAIEENVSISKMIATWTFRGSCLDRLKKLLYAAIEAISRSR